MGRERLVHENSLKDQFQALLIIAIASCTLIGTLAVSRALRPVNCGCGSDAFGNCLVSPCPGREMIVMESYKVNSSTNVTLTLMNTGPIVVQLVSYTVAEPNMGQFANLNWTGPVINPNWNMNATILIDGKSFTFQSAPTCMITVVTSRNNPFTFTVIG